MDKKAFQKLSYGVYVCTTWANGEPKGCIANSAMQVTSEPATVAVSINKENFTHQCIEEGGFFAIGILGEKSDAQVIGTFGFRSGKDFDKFAETPYTVRGKLPIPDTCIAYIACKVIGKMETSTHTVFLGEAIDAETLKEDNPMTYAYYHKVLKGKTAAKAPTYTEEAEAPKGDAKYVCSVCGYTYDGDIPFEELPDDWVCPLCGVGKDMFTKFV